MATLTHEHVVEQARQWRADAAVAADWRPDVNVSSAAWSAVVEYVEGTRAMSHLMVRALFVLSVSLNLPQHEVVPFVEATIKARSGSGETEKQG